MRKFLLLLLVSFSVATTVVADTLNFTWDKVTTDVLGNPVVGLIGYKLYISLKAGTYTYPAAYITASKNTASVSVVTPGQHFAVVRAYNSVGESANSNEVVFTLNIQPPGAPAGLKVN